MKASICVVTFRQENYILECLQSLVSQEANFEYEIIVGVDAGSDRTKDIVLKIAAEHPSKVKTIIHTNNVGASTNYRSVHSVAVGKYIAHCDGDDFWHPGKLQYQVDFLEANQSVVQCWHCATLIDNHGKTIGIFPSSLARFVYKRKLLVQDIALSYALVGQHSTHMYRKAYRPDLEAENDFLDYLVALKIATHGVSYYSKQKLSSYRVRLTETATSSNSAKKLAVDYLAIHAAKASKEYVNLAPFFKANIISRILFSYIKGHDVAECLTALKSFHGVRTEPFLVLKSILYFLAQKIRF